MKINWKVRLKQKTFLTSIFSSLLLLAQAISSLFGFNITEEFGQELTYTFNCFLSALVITGIIVDPTTQGLADSENAQDYEEPK